MNPINPESAPSPLQELIQIETTLTSHGSLKDEEEEIPKMQEPDFSSITLNSANEIESLSFSDWIWLCVTPSHSLSSESFRHDFLLSYRYFCNGESLLERLVARFISLETHKIPVLELLILWVGNVWTDFICEPDLLKNAKEFASACKADTDPNISRLAKTLAEKIEHQTLSPVPVPQIPKHSPPSLLFPYSEYESSRQTSPVVAQGELGRFLDIHPKEIARQITLEDFELFYAIDVNDFFHLRWSKHKEDPSKGATVVRFIQRANQLSNWTSNVVLSASDPMIRVRLVAHFVDMSTELKAHGNYSGAIAILCGLTNGALARLKKTWNSLSTEHRKACDELNLLMDNNFTALRKILENAFPPVLPYLGIFLADLTFLAENQTFLQPEMVNHFKFRKISATIRLILRFKEHGFAFNPVPSIRSFIQEQLQAHGVFDETEAFNQSLVLEPREKNKNLSGSFLDLSISSLKPLKLSQEGLMGLLKDTSYAPLLEFSQCKFDDRDVISGPIVQIFSFLTQSPCPPPKHKTTCGSCSNKIVGPRFHCLFCKNFDSCESCVAKPLHKFSHVFLKIPVVIMGSYNYPKLDEKDVVFQEKNLVTHQVTCSFCQRPSFSGARYRDISNLVDLCENCSFVLSSFCFSTQPELRFSKALDSSEPKCSSKPFSLSKEQQKAELNLFCFLLLYPSLISSDELLELIKKRWYIPHPPTLTHSNDQNDFSQLIVGPIRRSLIDLIAFWLGRFWERDFVDHPALKENLSDFLLGVCQTSKRFPDLDKDARLLLLHIDSKKGWVSPKSSSNVEPWKGDFSLMQWKANDLAQRLTSAMFEDFSQIGPKDWTVFFQIGPQTKEIFSTHRDIDRVRHFLERVETATRAIACQLLMAKGLEEKLKLSEHLLTVVVTMRNLQNLQGVAMIRDAFQMSGSNSLLPLLEKDLSSQIKLSTDQQIVFEVPPAIPDLGALIDQLKKKVFSLEKKEPEKMPTMMMDYTLAKSILATMHCCDSTYNKKSNFRSFYEAFLLQAPSLEKIKELLAQELIASKSKDKVGQILGSKSTMRTFTPKGSLKSFLASITKKKE